MRYKAMSDLKIEDLSDQSPTVKTLQAALEKATGQQVPIVNVLKPTRKSGVSVRPIELVLAGGQAVMFLVRQGGDVYRVQINGKDFPYNGDLSLGSATDKAAPKSPKSTAIRQGGAGFVEAKTFQEVMAQIATAIRTGQAAFDKKKTTAKVVIPPAKDDKGRTIPKNTTQMLKQVMAEEAEIDAVITQKTEQRDTMKLQLEQKQAQAPLPAPAM